MKRLHKLRRNYITPSLRGRVGLGLFICLILCGCITEYEATGIDELGDILVVEGIITDDETTITLSKSMTLTGVEDYSYSYWINNAKVSVEDDVGMQWHASFIYNGQYTIMMGQLNPDRKYSLKIEIDGYHYESDPSHPIQTPEIDSVFWMKRDKGQPVTVHVTTHSPDNKVLYYRWSYQEDWETQAEYWVEDYPFYCWNKAINRNLLLGSAEKTVFGKITDILTEMPPSSRKLSELYRIDVKQNAISKRAYDYFANIKKNSQQTGSIFAPVPSELRGNITCTTDPSRPVIGYIDISATTKKRRYIPRSEGAYESTGINWECQILTGAELIELEGEISPEWVLFDRWANPPTYIKERCVDCTYYDTTEKPDDWPR